MVIDKMNRKFNSTKKKYTGLLSLFNTGLFFFLSLLGYTFFKNTSVFNILPNLSFLLFTSIFFIWMVRSDKFLSLEMWFISGAALFFSIGPVISIMNRLNYNYASLNLLNSATVFLVAIVIYIFPVRHLDDTSFFRNFIKKSNFYAYFYVLIFLLFIYIACKFLFFSSNLLLVKSFINKGNFIIQSFAFVFGISCNYFHKKKIKFIFYFTFSLLIFYSLISFSKLGLMYLALGYYLGKLVSANTRANFMKFLLIPPVLLALYGPICAAGRLNNHFLEDNSISERIYIFSYVTNNLFFNQPQIKEVFRKKIDNYRVRKTDNNGLNTEPSDQFVNNFKGNNLGKFNFLSRFNSVPIQSYLINQRNLGYNGTSLYSLKYVLIPRILWPNKPILSNDGALLFRAFYPNVDWVGESSLAPTFNAEAYWNFGIIGVILMSVYIGLIIQLFNWLFFVKFRNCFTPFFIYPAILLLFSVESWIVLSYVGGVITLLFIYFSSQAFSHFISKINYASQ